MFDVIWKAFWEMFAIAVFGAILYCVDRTWGRTLFRGLYRWTHRDPIPEGRNHGGILYLYNRKTETQVKAASILSILTNVTLLVTHQNQWLFSLCMMIVDVPGIVMGATWIGPMLYKMGARLPGAYTYVDAVHEGKIRPLDQAAKAAMRAATTVAAPVRSGVSELFGGREASLINPEPTEPAVEIIPPVQETDPRDALRNYTRRS